ncbi:hypothetical protein [Bradyrhizobium sp. CER78]|uniref:hypothetical protein n=1 Tax=Bradyrhizobium sp. CER78 TaxID=3039162 RepID=UPI002447B374|nr:hypothetical protein [Bradyrhizobium sp. CER78]MDH2381841.1 hypothetical protein [Bradyrhizobium sp. CER78]
MSFRDRAAHSGALVASLLVTMMTSPSALACDTGQEDYYGRCVKDESAPAKLLTFLNGYGRRANAVGDVADLFAPDVPLFDKLELGRKVVHTWKRPNADVESEARIEKVLPDFYYVTVSIYEGPTSCGIEEYKLKGPKTTLRGYVPKTNPQGVPSLWMFRHMTGLC